MKTVYLDYNASTPIAPQVVDAMRPHLTEHWGNPSSGHWASVGAAEALSHARRQVASLIGAQPSEIVFNSGGSEANNHAIKGSVFPHIRGNKPVHIVISNVEHPAVQSPCRYLEGFGASLTEVPVDRHGLVSPDDVGAAMRPETVLVSIMHANNEVGTIQPIAEIARVAKSGGALMHSDAAQSIGKIPTNVDELGVDLLSIVGHKLYAPKGVGALYIREGVTLDPLVHGATHEHGHRAGTENVLLAAGLGAACELAASDSSAEHIESVTQHFWARLQAAFGDKIRLNGHPERRLPNTLNVSFDGQLSADIMASMQGVAASAGSACHAGSHTMSPVLFAMGVDESWGLGAVRFSMGRSTTIEQVDRVVEQLRRAL